MVITEKLAKTQIKPSLKSYISLLQTCAQTQDLQTGKKTHTLILTNGHFHSPVSATSLINMYSKCTSISDAVKIFNTSTHFHNVFVYNSIISGLTLNSLPLQAFQFYRKMRSFNIEPDKFTFPCVIKSCCNVYDLRVVHGLLFKFRLCFDVFIGSALVHSYLKFQEMDDAVKVFDKMPERDDVVIWNAMVNGYVQIGEFGKGLVVFRKMVELGLVGNRVTVSGVLSGLALSGDVWNGTLIHSFAVKMGFDSGVAVLNALIDMYGKCRLVEDAFLVFEYMVDKDMYSWNSIISVCEQSGDHEGTLRLLKEMLSFGLWPDLVTVTAALPACSHLAALMHGREIHGYMIINGLDRAGNTYTDNAIMDMYAKCGSMREARLVFDGIEVKDVASWNIMVMGYGMQGFGNEALDLFTRMCDSGLRPDEVSFVGVLAACNHGGFIDRGRELLKEMESRYAVTPAIEHYACVIDMLGRAGKIDEAFELISNMSIKPNQVVWRSFLAACLLHGNADLAEVAVSRLLELEPEHCGNYVLMSNIYGAAGRYEEVAVLRHTMRQHDVKKLPGCSWIKLGDGMHVFLNGDQSHPAKYFVYEGLDSLTACLRGRGYTHDVMESYL